MKSKKDWIYKLDDNSLNYLLKNKNKLTRTPDKLNDKALELIRNSNTLIKKEKKHFQFKMFSNIYRNAFASAVLAALIITFIFIIFILKPDLGFMVMKNFSEIEKLNGNAGIIRKEKYSTLSADYKIKKDDIIKTEIDSNITLKIGDDSRININELSELKIISLRKKNENEINKLYL